jgi:hypothetical protein
MPRRRLADSESQATLKYKHDFHPEGIADFALEQFGDC